MNATACEASHPLPSHSPAELLANKYVAALNSQNPDAVARCFGPDAQVEDEQRLHTGTIQIHAWIAEAFEKYHPRIEVREVTGDDGQINITGLVSGTFDGSPVMLQHQLEHDGWLITHLAIHPAE